MDLFQTRKSEAAANVVTWIIPLSISNKGKKKLCGEESAGEVELTWILPLSVPLLMLFQTHCFHRCACPWPGFPWGPGDPWSPFSPCDPIGPRGPKGPAWPSRPGWPLAPGIPGVPGVPGIPGIPGIPTLRSLQMRYGALGFWIEWRQQQKAKQNWTRILLKLLDCYSCSDSGADQEARRASFPHWPAQTRRIRYYF